MFSEAQVKYSKDFIKEEYDRKLLLLMAFIRIHASASGKVISSINYMVRDMGYTPNCRSGEINDKFIQQIKFLEQEEYISLSCDIDNIKPNTCFLIQVNNEKNIFNPDNRFVLLTESEYRRITSSKTKIDKATLLSVFLFIKQRINMTEGHMHVAYPAYSTLKRECMVSSASTIVSSVNELCGIGVLYQHITGSYINKDGKARNAVNAYALSANDLVGVDDFMKQVVSSNQGITIEKFGEVIKPLSNEKKAKIQYIYKQQDEFAYLELLDDLDSNNFDYDDFVANG